ncbi:MAG: response regulator [Sedimentibacter saalensis]|uniref:response regulator n=1 Tax=Sedimentibacter saalensis TaxID=130788 RepID=UPI002B20A844|nr:response regulator [Sedimentibacter saalensis]MEA5093401.1 response regulator [Sedimentibacter saalensis]
MDNGYNNKTLKLLIIDDNKDLTEIMCDLIGFLGHKTICSQDGKDGIAMAKEHHPDVIICDIGLPVMDGYEVAQQLRKDDEIKETFLIALSGYAGVEDRKRSREAGFDRHLAKPADISAIERVIAEAAMRIKQTV